MLTLAAVAAFAVGAWAQGAYTVQQLTVPDA